MLNVVLFGTEPDPVSAERDGGGGHNAHARVGGAPERLTERVAARADAKVPKQVKIRRKHRGDEPDDEVVWLEDES